MIEKSKKLAIFFIVLSILLFIGGICFSNLAESNRGAGISGGQVINGSYFIMSQGTIGGNKKGSEAAEAMAIGCYVSAVICLLTGVGYANSVRKKNNIVQVYKKGKILDKESDDVIVVEFEDKTRKKLIVEPPLIVTQGDKGRFGYKNNSLIEFIKE